MDATEMELAGQIKKHRQALGISQEALAEKIYVSRQTISNWETARTYPDVQSLLLLSVAFDISIDELIKGDVETMEESVRKADHSLIWMYAAEMLLTVIAIVALFFALDSFIEKNTTSGFACLLVFATTFATALGLSFAVKKAKVRNNILTYQEILTFCAGEEPNRTSRYNAFVRKHKSAHDMRLVMLSAIFGAALVVVLRFIF